jgi:hypothetical protein
VRREAGGVASCPCEAAPKKTRADSSLCPPARRASCLSTATHVDVGSISQEWLQAWLKAAQPRLSAFAPVQLANTAEALALAAAAHPFTSRLVHVGWQGPLVEAVRVQLSNGRCNGGNLAVLARRLRQPPFMLTSSGSEAAQQLMRDIDAALAAMGSNGGSERGRSVGDAAGRTAGRLA